MDYEHYAIVYECIDKPDESSSHFLWVSSRTPTMSESVSGTVNELLNAYFDVKEVKNVEQNEVVCGSRE